MSESLSIALEGVGDDLGGLAFDGLSSPSAPSGTVGIRSLLATWLGGASISSTTPGFRSMLAFWMGGAGVSSGLVGRKRRRLRGRRRLYVEELVREIEQAPEDKYSQEVVEQARQIISAKTDLEIAKRMMKAGEAKKARLSILEARVEQAEERMLMIRDEEDFILLLALTL